MVTSALIARRRVFSAERVSLVIYNGVSPKSKVLAEEERKSDVYRTVEPNHRHSVIVSYPNLDFHFADPRKASFISEIFARTCPERVHQNTFR